MDCSLIMKNFWQYINGKKTIIAEIFWLNYIYILPTLFPDGYPHWVKITLLIIGAMLSFFGLGHKAYKRHVRIRNARIYKK